jgi:hypothetical protein
MSFSKITNFILTLTSILICIFLINLYLDYTIYQKGNSSSLFDNKPDNRNIYKVLEDTKGTLYPNLGSMINNPDLSNILLDKKLIFFGDISNSKILLCNETGQYKYYQSDDYGFRNISNEYNGKENLIIGDSFGLGICIDDKIYLKKNYSNTNNLSVSGSGPLSQIALISEYVNKFELKNLIWFFYEGNDLLDFREELKNLTLKQYQDLDYKQWPRFDFFDNKKLLDDIVKKYIAQSLQKNVSSKFYETKHGKEFSLKRLLKLTALRNILRNLRNILSYEQAYIFNEYNEVMNKINSILVEKNVKITIVFLPSYKRILEKEENSQIKEIKTLLKTNFKNIELLDFGHHLLNKSVLADDVFVTKKSHYTETTYEELYKFLDKNL